MMLPRAASDRGHGVGGGDEARWAQTDAPKHSGPDFIGVHGLEVDNTAAAAEAPVDSSLRSLTPWKKEPSCSGSMRGITRPSGETSSQTLRTASLGLLGGSPGHPARSGNTLEFIFPLETDLATNLQKHEACAPPNYHPVSMRSAVKGHAHPPFLPKQRKDTEMCQSHLLESRTDLSLEPGNWRH